MTKYKHYSFDLWLTLIKSNPEFKKQRALFFYQEYNFKKKTIAEVETVFRNIDIMCNTINEKTGKNIDTDEMYLMVISSLNENEVNFDSVDLSGMYKHIERILFNYMPVIFSGNTIEILDKIKGVTNSTFNILSNTAFIKGETLRKVLSHLNILNYFNFHIYSDEVGLSKPNKLIFEMMIESAKRINNEDNLLMEECIHIGDNFFADIEGAKKLGIPTLQINSNKNNIANLLK